MSKGLGPKHDRRVMRVWKGASASHAKGWHYAHRRIHRKALRVEAKQEVILTDTKTREVVEIDRDLTEWEKWILHSLGKLP